MLTVALAKGRTAEDVLPLWSRAGIAIPEGIDDSRALVFETEDANIGRIRYLLAKPVDVPTYVQFGVADLGVVGKDILMEHDRDVFELLDLRAARCRLCVAGKPQEQAMRPRRVATKYPRLADRYFASQGAAVEIVVLSGSIELAPVIGLTDRIFDLVQTGETLRAHDLIEFDTVAQVSARLIANQSSYRTKRDAISKVTEALSEALDADAKAETKAVRGQ